jgi:MazG family protein
MRAMSTAFDRLVGIMERLREPGGCPWDREQTLETLSAYVLEETYEVLDAIRGGDPGELCSELGDLLLQIVFMARIASEEGRFTIDDVCDSISEKMIRRHPHVFGETEVDDAAEVLRNWEDIKVQERRAEAGDGSGAAPRSALDGIPSALPALLKAYRMTEKAAALGFDWDRPADVIDKLHEEVAELEAEVRDDDPASLERARSELGDVLFVMANLARHLELEPETALQSANAKFQRRFRAMERSLQREERELRSASMDELEDLWSRAKESERAPMLGGGPQNE